MVRVQIGSETKDINEVTARWVTQQIERRGADGQTTCVQVEIKTDDVKLSCATRSCGMGGGGGVPPRYTLMERRIIEEWNKHHLGEPAFTGGHVEAFLKAVKRLLGL